MAMNSWAIPGDLAVVKGHLAQVVGASFDEDGTTTDDLLESMVSASTLVAEEHTGRHFVTRERTEEHVGDGRSVLLLYRSPIVEVTEVLIDGEPVTDFTIEKRRGVLRRTLDWPRNSIVQVTYTAGYGDRETVEAEHPALVQWVLERVARAFSRGREGLSAETISGVGATTWGPEDYSLLAPYRRIV